MATPTKLKISFSNVIEIAHLKAIAKVYKWEEEVINPKFDKTKPASKDNPMKIPSSISDVDFAINKLAEMTGAIVTHEVTYPITGDVSPKELQQKKQEVMDDLRANFELAVTEVE